MLKTKQQVWIDYYNVRNPWMQHVPSYAAVSRPVIIRQICSSISNDLSFRIGVSHQNTAERIKHCSCAVLVVQQCKWVDCFASPMALVYTRYCLPLSFLGIACWLCRLCFAAVTTINAIQSNACFCRWFVPKPMIHQVIPTKVSSAVINAGAISVMATFSLLMAWGVQTLGATQMIQAIRLPLLLQTRPRQTAVHRKALLCSGFYLCCTRKALICRLLAATRASATSALQVRLDALDE